MTQHALEVPTKSSVRKAGDKLKDPSLDHTEALEVLSTWRALHSYPINTFQATLRRKVEALGLKKAIIAQRLKRLPSIISKLQRINGMKLDRMQDIGGVRIVLSSTKDVYALYDNLPQSNRRFEHEPQLPPKDYIQQPKSDGYRCLHQVFKYKSRTHPELNGLCIELQIRTHLQHAWATAVETLGIVEKSSFKTGEGSEDFKTFFKLTSALFSIKEGTPILDEYSHYSLDELKEEARLLEQKLQVFIKLRGLSITNRHIESATSESADYHLIELSRVDDIWRVSLTPFTKAQLDFAEQMYELREQKTKNDPNSDVVLVSVGSLKQLKKAYPNYFLDTEEFIKQLSIMLK